MAFPFLQWWPLVNRDSLKADASAGLTGAIVVLPQGVAFATIAGMPPEYGLYAAMVPAVIAALFGSSWHLVSGPTTAASIVLFSSLSALAEPGSAEYVSLAITLTFMVGLLQLAMGLARLGTLVNFISHSVIIGFTAGAALLIGGSQLKHFFGLEMERGLHFHQVLAEVVSRFGDINLYVTSVALLTLVSGILIRRFVPKVPYMIGAMLLGSGLSVVLNAWLGQDATGIQTVGALPAQLPPLSAPDLSLDTIRALAPVTLAATLFALTEAVSISRSLAARSGQVISGNQEFIGQGLSNLLGSFFSAYVATGSFNRSGVNYAAGARTPMAAIIAGVLLIGIVLAVAPLTAYLPNATMAGILMLVAWGLIDFHHIGQIIKASRSESMVLGVTFVATLFLELEFAILLGIILSLVVYLSKTSRPAVHIRVPDPRLPKREFVTDPQLPECPQARIVRIDGSLFFGAVPYVREKLREMDEAMPTQKSLLIIAKGINFVDVAGAEFLAEEAKRRRAMGGKLYLYEVKEGACERLTKSGLIDQIGRENVFDSKTRAITTIINDLDPKICQRCDKRIFMECEATSCVPQAYIANSRASSEADQAKTGESKSKPPCG
jgi:SulP family sulfate permease